MFTVYGAEDGICLVMAITFFLIDLKIVATLQQPSLYYTGDRVFTFQSLKNAVVGQKGLFDTEEGPSDVRGAMGSPVVGFQNEERGGGEIR